MTAKILATLTALVGGAGAILTLLVAFGVNITPDQHTAIDGVLAVALLIAGLWFHPDVPIGTTEKKP